MGRKLTSLVCAVALAAAAGCGETDEEQAREVAQAHGFSFVGADLSRRGDCRRAVEETLAALGGLDVLVNNAGFQHIDPIKDFPEDTWDQMLHVMLTAPFLLSKYAWAHLTRSGQGRIVNIASIAGMIGRDRGVRHGCSLQTLDYDAAKGGLIALTRGLAAYVGRGRVRINAISPGGI